MAQVGWRRAGAGRGGCARPVGVAAWAVLACVLAGNAPLRAEILYDAVSSAVTSTAGTSLSWSHTIGSGSYRLLTVGVSIEDDSSADCVVSSVTYNGTALAQAASVNVTSSSTYLCVSLWYLNDPSLPAAGTYTVAVTTTGTVTDIDGGATSLTGAMQAAPEATNTGSCTTCSDAISTSVTTLSSDAWVIATVGCGNAAGFTATGTNQTERYDVAGTTSSGAGSTTRVAVAGSATSSWTQTGANRLAQVVASFAPANSMLVFQDGVAPTTGYTGTQDTYLDGSSTTTNFSTSTPLQLDGSSGPNDGVLIKFDLSQIPTSSVVLSASLEVNVTNASTESYEAYEVLRNWVVNQATWNNYATGSAWTTAGAQGAGTDRGSTSLGTITGGTGKVTMTFNGSGIALVQRWVSTPSANYGITLQDYSNSDGLDFSADDDTTASNRPLLTVTYRRRRVVIN